MSNYNKYTPSYAKRFGCGECGQKGGAHARYCMFHPEVQALAAKRARQAELDLRFLDLWNAVTALQKQIAEISMILKGLA